jgi:hypothetical protein
VRSQLSTQLLNQPLPNAQFGRGHTVQIYNSEQDLCETVSKFIGGGLLIGEGALIVATAQHRLDFELALQELGVDVTDLKQKGRLALLDASETLAKFLVDGQPNPELFEKVVGRLIQEMAVRHSPVRIYGEMVGLLLANGNPEGTVRLEQLWNEIEKKHPFSLLCGYYAKSFNGTAEPKVYGDICALHAHRIPPEPRVTSSSN